MPYPDFNRFVLIFSQFKDQSKNAHSMQPKIKAKTPTAARNIESIARVSPKLM